MWLGAGAKTQAALHTAARGVAHVAQCVEFFRGSRVEDYQPLSHLLSTLATPALLAPGQPSTPLGPPPSKQASLRNSSEGQAAVVEGAGVAATVADDMLPEVQEFVAPSLSEQALRLLQAFVAGHDQVSSGCAHCHVAEVVRCDKVVATGLLFIYPARRMLLCSSVLGSGCCFAAFIRSCMCAVLMCLEGLSGSVLVNAT